MFVYTVLEIRGVTGKIIKRFPTDKFFEAIVYTRKKKTEVIKFRTFESCYAWVHKHTLREADCLCAHIDEPNGFTFIQCNGTTGWGHQCSNKGKVWIADKWLCKQHAGKNSTHTVRSIALPCSQFGNLDEQRLQATCNHDWWTFSNGSRTGCVLDYIKVVGMCLKCFTFKGDTTT